MPACVNCRTSGFTCPFLTQAGLKPANTSTDTTPGAASPAGTAITNQTPLLTDPEYVVNLNHIDLWCHFCSETWKDFYSSSSQGPAALEETILVFRKFILSSPYLMHQALATAALHMSITRPENTEYYRNYAAALHTRAVTLFNDVLPNVDDSNRVPAFAFSSLLGTYLLGDALRHHTNDFRGLLERFTQCLHLRRGMLAVVGGSWSIIRETGLLSHTEGMNPVKGFECDPLLDLLRSGHLDSASIEVYQTATEHLQSTFDMYRYLSEKDASIHAIFAWPTLVSADYTQLLHQQRPEALIILAYYAVLLHWQRKVWVFGNGGRVLIESIRRAVGPLGERWLVWPVAQLDVEG